MCQRACQRGWPILIPFDDKLVLLPQSTYLSEGVADFLIPYEHRLIVPTPVNIFVEGGGE